MFSTSHFGLALGRFKFYFVGAWLMFHTPWENIVKVVFENSSLETAEVSQFLPRTCFAAPTVNRLLLFSCVLHGDSYIADISTKLTFGKGNSTASMLLRRYCKIKFSSRWLRSAGLIIYPVLCPKLTLLPPTWSAYQNPSDTALLSVISLTTFNCIVSASITKGALVCFVVTVHWWRHKTHYDVTEAYRALRYIPTVHLNNGATCADLRGIPKHCEVTGKAGRQ